MTIEFQCPHCSKLLKTPDDKAGVRANCPGCGQIVTIPDPASEAALADHSFATVEAEARAEEKIPDARSIADETGSQYDTKPCPMCGAAIKKAARRCRFCGETLVREGSSERVPTKIEAGEILSHAWEIYKAQIGLLVGALLVVGGITLLVSFAGSFIQQMLILSVGRPAGGGNQAALGVGVLGLTFLFTILNVAVTAYLQAGLHILLLRVARGENAEISNLFSGTRFFWRFFWGTWLFQIMLVLGFAMLIVPGVILSLMFWPLFYVIVDRDVGVIESLRMANEVTTGNYLAVFVLFLAGMGIQMLGVFPGFCIGLLFTSPLWAILFAVAYCGMNGQVPLQHRESR